MTQFTSPRPLNLKLRKPRNPLVAHALMRQAGKHGHFNTGSSQRQTARRDLHKQTLEMTLPDSSA
ncbi:MULTISPECIES: hypothetical protein [Roseateles]|uniref:Uncharacterized protein n=1 Tax=Roseateles albus TaxID=2987525 RepID=A0ABT5KL95_9BURK|nr:MULTISPECIES: hypothetical protein [Roseateles]MCV2361488.1 hypothetical protein [Paucibacter sp. TC2R-5]MDC8774224.1 hypothetical protein [Roseateles albus]